MLPVAVLIRRKCIYFQARTLIVPPTPGAEGTGGAAA